MSLPATTAELEDQFRCAVSGTELHFLTSVLPVEYRNLKIQNASWQLGEIYNDLGDFHLRRYIKPWAITFNAYEIQS